MSWHVHPGRIREVRRKGLEVLAVYWDLTDEWAMTWPIKQDRQCEPGVISRFRLFDEGWVREKSS